jgi:hypothetical protein
MRTSRNFAWPLAAVLFGLTLLPTPARAKSADCPVEPKTGVPLVSGDVYAGANCTLNSPTDVDGFTFNANSGDIYQVIVGISGGDQNVCMKLIDPNGMQIFAGCSGVGGGGFPYVLDDVTVTVAGTYTVDISEAGAGTVSYGVSLERLFPTPADAKPVLLGQLITGTISPVADTPAFTFTGATTGQFQVAASLPVAEPNLCETVYSPKGVSVASGCTMFAEGGNPFIDLVFTPTQAGTYLVILNEATNSATTNYDFEVSCVSGNCGKTKGPPLCTLKDSANYSASTSTLTMNFTVENTSVTTWNAWLTSQDTITNLFSQSQPITNPAQVITKTTPLSPAGTVGVLTTFTTPTKGIICSNYTQLKTGTPP